MFSEFSKHYLQNLSGYILIIHILQHCINRKINTIISDMKWIITCFSGVKHILTHIGQMCDISIKYTGVSVLHAFNSICSSLYLYHPLTSSDLLRCACMYNQIPRQIK